MIREDDTLVKPVDEADEADLVDMMEELYGRNWWEVCND
jgi:hypothetical protein